MSIEVTEGLAGCCMGNNNTVDCEVVVFSGEVTIEGEQSNDLENWTIVGDASSSLRAPYTLVGSRNITCQYVQHQVHEEWVSYGCSILRHQSLPVGSGSAEVFNVSAPRQSARSY